MRRSLATEGNSRFQIDWASLVTGTKFTVFALFYFVFGIYFLNMSSRGAYIWRGDSTEGILRYHFGGAFTWNCLYSGFHGILD